jgi:hypothetical protein
MDGKCAHLPKERDALVVRKKAADVSTSKRTHVGMGVSNGDGQYRNEIRSLNDKKLVDERVKMVCRRMHCCASNRCADQMPTNAAVRAGVAPAEYRCPRHPQKRD